MLSEWKEMGYESSVKIGPAKARVCHPDRNLEAGGGAAREGDLDVRSVPGHVFEDLSEFYPDDLPVSGWQLEWTDACGPARHLSCHLSRTDAEARAFTWLAARPQSWIYLYRQRGAISVLVEVIADDPPDVNSARVPTWS